MEGEAPEGDAQPAACAAEAATAFGVMCIGEALLALPVDFIREVIPAQQAYARLPVDVAGLRGAIDLRGTVIPVLDLRSFLGLPTPAAGSGAVVVMRWRGKLLGLLADEVRGVVRAADAQLFEFAIEQAAERLPLATHGMKLGGETAALLDAGRIAALPNIPMVAEEQRGASRQAAAREPMLLFSDRGMHLGIPAFHVDATVPRLPIVRGALTGGYCLGTVEHHGHDVPVLDTLAALGLGAAASPAEAALLVLRFTEGLLGFTLDDVRDIARPTAEDVLAMPRLPGGASGLFRGLLADAQGRQNLLLDIDALRRHPPFVTIAGLSRVRPAAVSPAEAAQRPDAAAAQAAARAGRRQFITFRAGREHATPLADVLEILPYPKTLTDMRSMGGGLIGIFHHRNAAVPLVDLAQRLGGRCTLDPASARVLLVKAEEQTVGLAVEALHSIEPIAPGPWTTDLPAGKRGKSLRVVLVGEGSQRRLLPLADIAALLGDFTPAQADEPTASEPEEAPPEVELSA